MSFDYSIETSIENIQNSKTKYYFLEVYQTYINKNYRSSIVMLYSVLICDLVFKLRDLRDLYSDEKAEKILKEIEELQSKNLTSSEWESKLVEAIKTRTNLLESSDFVAIESLQKFRHLSAHPVLSNGDLLYTPNKETVQSLMRNILEGVLTNPPFFSNKIFDTMLNDLIEVEESINEEESLEKYLVSRYISRLKDNDFLKVFRSLWKLVFIALDAKSILHEQILFNALRVLTKQRKSICIEIVKTEPNYYSNITNSLKLGRLIGYLAQFPEFYLPLDASLKIIVDKQSKNDDEYVFVSWFQKGNIKEHFSQLNHLQLGPISLGCIKFMETVCINNGGVNEYCDFLIKHFAISNSYGRTHTMINNVGECLARNITLQQANTLLSVSNSNEQIYQSWSMPEKLIQIVKRHEREISKEDFPYIYGVLEKS